MALNPPQSTSSILVAAGDRQPIAGASPVEQMTDEMLIAQAKWLPQYRAQMPAVKRRYAKAEKLARFDSTGACRKAEADVATVGKRNAATAAKRKAGKILNITEPEG